jgi:hypothetical protein
MRLSIGDGSGQPISMPTRVEQSLLSNWWWPIDSLKALQDIPARSTDHVNEGRTSTMPRPKDIITQRSSLVPSMTFGEAILPHQCTTFIIRHLSPSVTLPQCFHPARCPGGLLPRTLASLRVVPRQTTAGAQRQPIPTTRDWHFSDIQRHSHCRHRVHSRPFARHQLASLGDLTHQGMR